MRRLSPPRGRRGFTMIELAVSVFVLIVLVAILLPALNSIRESAARTQCAGNLRQVGNALSQYYLTNRTFPWGHLDLPQHGAQANFSLPWSVYILPYLGQESLYAKFNTTMGVTTVTNTTPAAYVDFNDPSNTSQGQGQVPLPVYICPSSPSQGVVYTDNWTAVINCCPEVAGPPTWTVSASDYQTTSGVENHYVLKLWTSATSPYAANRNGVMQDNDLVSHDMIKGLSTTTVVGEVGGAPNLWAAGKLIQSPPYADAAGNPIITGANPNGLYPQGTAWADSFNGENWLHGVDATGTTDGSCVLNCSNASGAGFYSFHPGGANFLFADGSVHFLATGINQRTLVELILIVRGPTPGPF